MRFQAWCEAHLVMSSWRREVNCEGKKPGKYFCRKLKMSTWPTGVSGAIRMIAKGMKVSRSLAVRRSACTCAVRRQLVTIRSIPV